MHFLRTILALAGLETTSVTCEDASKKKRGIWETYIEFEN